MKMVRLSTISDFPGWMRLAGEVEPLFGPMVDDPAFCDGLKQAIRQGNAFCLTESDPDGREGDLLGGIVISREANEIVWLAVARRRRGRKIGAALLSEALQHLDGARPVAVTTFAKTVEAGTPARRLYASFGFRDSLEAGANLAGIPIVTMARQKQTRMQNRAGEKASLR